MKRKIIKQGHGTLTMTLPKKWANKFGVKPGDEIELNEKENGLFISTEKKGEELKTEMDITGLDISSLWRYFMGVYREGYDEVRVLYDSDAIYSSPYRFFTAHAIDIKYNRKDKYSPIEAIQEITNRFIGFEVIEHHKEHCLVKGISEPSTKEFDASLRRIFLLIQQMGDEIKEAINTNNPRVVRHTHDIDINIDKFNNYCIRVLNKTGFKTTRKTSLMFCTLYLLELIGDEFKSIGKHLSTDMKSEDLSNLALFTDLVTEQFNKYYDLFYTFQKESVVEISKKDTELHTKFPKLYKKNGKKSSSLTGNELEIFNHLRRINQHVNAVTELRVEMEF